MPDKLTVEEVMKKIKDYVKGEDISQTENLKELDCINQFTSSKEKVNINTYVRSDLPVISERKFVGRFIVFFKKFLRKILRWYINPIVEQQNKFNETVTLTINDLNNVLDTLIGKLIEAENEKKSIYIEIERLKQMISSEGIEIEKIKEDCCNKETKVKELKEDFDREVQDLKEDFDKEVQELKERLENKDLEVKEIRELSSNNQNTLYQANDTIKSILSENTLLSNRINRLDKRILSNVNQDYSIKSLSDNNTILDNNNFDYFLFEQRFRGSEQQIKDNQRSYLKYFAKGDTVLDIGCGRGEFIELLTENGIKAKGVDINEGFVENCKDKNLDVEKMDVVEYLESLKDETLNGIFISHVVEHLSFGELNYTIELCHKKLKQNGCIIIETPNTRTLAIFTNAFFVDPSHTKPVHPETLKFLLEGLGFRNIELLHNEYSKVNYSVPLLDGEQIKNLKDFNNGINVINDLLFGYQDYTIIARK